MGSSSLRGLNGLSRQVVRGLDISQVSSSHVGTTPSIVIWLNTIYYTTDQPFTWRNGKPLVHSTG